MRSWRAALSLQGSEGKGPLTLDGAGKGSDPLSRDISCTLPPQLTVRVGIRGKVITFKVTLLLAY